MTQERTCSVCRKKANKAQLIRIVRNKDGNVSVDPSGKADGRGCYVCNDVNCIKRLQKSAALGRSFRCRVESAIYEKIEEELIELKNSDNGRICNP